MILLIFSFSSLLCCKNTVHNTYNIQNICSLTVYVVGKASGPQQAISSEVLGQAKIIYPFSAVQLVAASTSSLFKGQLCKCPLKA